MIFLKNIQPLTYDIHKLMGLTILGLVILRLLWALINPKPVLPAETFPLQKLAERLFHAMLYMFVILMPLAGWIGSVAEGRAPYLGHVSFELPIDQNKALADAAFNLHGTTAIILIVLISLHTLAALYHHFIRKDDILMRMLPKGRHR